MKLGVIGWTTEIYLIFSGKYASSTLWAMLSVGKIKVKGSKTDQNAFFSWVNVIEKVI